MNHHLDSNAHDAPLILAADVGGTKTFLQLRRADDTPESIGTPVAEQRYASQSFHSLEAMVQRFLEESGQPLPRSACFAVAGPLQQEGGYQRAQLTNLPWKLDSVHMSATLGIPQVTLLNDFQAIGYSLGILAADDLSTLHGAPAQERGPCLVVGAGTGLGVCIVMPDGEQTTSHPSEGGHMAFAPQDAQQRALFDFLQPELERISCERLVSGSGLVAIYRFLSSRENRGGQDPLLSAADPAAAIGEQAVAGTHGLAVEAVTLFMRLYGSFAGDMSLACLPTGGVYIAGGIAPKLLSYLHQGAFMEAFSDKGRMSGLMKRFPVHVITNPQCGLLGAAHFAARL